MSNKFGDGLSLAYWEGALNGWQDETHKLESAVGMGLGESRMSSRVRQFAALLARAKQQQQRIRELEAQLNALRSAVKALPVDELVDIDRDGSPVLLGYIMQTQGEWDAVIKALEPPR